MAVTLLQSVPNIRRILGYEAGNEDVDTAILASLEKAAVTLEGKLRTGFLRGTVVDLFLARKLKFGTGTQTLAKLLLSRSFVDEAQTIAVRSSATLEGLDTDGSFIDLRSDDGFDHLLIEDAERGRIIVADIVFAGIDINYVRVSYTCGFTSDGGDPPQYSNIPDWLTTLSDVQTEMHTFHNPSLNPGLDTKDNKIKSESARLSILNDTLETMLQEHTRYGPGYAKPMRATFTAV